MKFLHILPVVVLLNGVISVRSAPALTDKESDDHTSKENNDEYSISSQTYNEKNNCTQDLDIFGKGIKENFTLPCSTGEIFSINSDKILIYEDPKNSFSLFSDKPSTLVVIEGGKCTNKTYTNADAGTSSTSAKMTNQECDEVKQKIAHEKEESWKLWKKTFEESLKMIFPPCFNLCLQVKPKDIQNENQ